MLKTGKKKRVEKGKKQKNNLIQDVSDTVTPEVRVHAVFQFIVLLT